MVVFPLSSTEDDRYRRDARLRDDRRRLNLRCLGDLWEREERRLGMGLEECRLGMGLEERRLGMDLEECTYKNFAGVWRFFGDTCEQCHRDTWYSTCDTHGIRRSPPGGIARVAPRHPPQPAADHGGRPPHQTFACTKLSRRNGGHPPPSPRLAVTHMASCDRLLSESTVRV